MSKKAEEKLNCIPDTVLYPAVKKRCIDKGVIKDEFLDPCYIYYVRNYEDNLINDCENIKRKEYGGTLIQHPSNIDPKHLDQYRSSNGNPLSPSPMCALHSSAAMAFNIFGNKTVTLNENAPAALGVSPGEFKLEYEKKLVATTVNGATPFVDVYLNKKAENGCEIVLFEIKMVEWVRGDKPKELAKSYGNKNNYPNPDKEVPTEPDLFTKLDELRKNLTDKESKDKYICKYKHFDAFQFYLHLCGICTALFCRDYLKKKEFGSFPEKLSKITLVDGIWTIPDAGFLEGTGIDHEKYEDDLEQEYYDEFGEYYERYK